MVPAAVPAPYPGGESPAQQRGHHQYERSRSITPPCLVVRVFRFRPFAVRASPQPGQTRRASDRASSAIGCVRICASTMCCRNLRNWSSTASSISVRVGHGCSPCYESISAMRARISALRSGAPRFGCMSSLPVRDTPPQLISRRITQWVAGAGSSDPTTNSFTLRTIPKNSRTPPWLDRLDIFPVRCYTLAVASSNRTKPVRRVTEGLKKSGSEQM